MTPTQFMAALSQGKWSPVYFLRGSDRFLQSECRAALLATLPEEARAWCVTEIEFKPGRLAHDLEGAYQMPMLGPRTCLLFYDLEDFEHAGEADYDALEAYLRRPAPSAIVVFTAMEPDRRRRFIQLLERKAEVVEMTPLDRHQAAGWLKHYLRRSQVEIDDQLAETVAARFEQPAERGARQAGVNLLWLRTEMEKVLAARPGIKRLEPADLELIVSFREEHEIGRLLEALAERDGAAALATLHRLLASKEPETLLLWSIGDLFRQALRTEASPGWTGGARYGAGYGGGWSNPLSTYALAPRVAKAYSPEELRAAMRLVHATDLNLKSSWKDAKILLEFLVWQIVTGRSAESGTIGEPALPAGAES
jgi:DNA polymerase III delta subunit